MKRAFQDKLTVVLALVTFGSGFFQRDFFYGLLLFFINFMTFKIIVGTLFKLSSDNNAPIRKYIFIPAMFIKMIAIGGISYFVLVYLEGSAYFYVGGFGVGLVIFSSGMSLAHFSKQQVLSKEK